MIVGVALTKSVSFRGVQQEFTNVYYYEDVTAVAVPAQTLIDDIKATEVSLHSSDVTFVRAKVWKAGGTPAQNEMVLQVPLSGTGNQAANTSMDRERAVLVRWPAGLDSRGHPVYLRKWYHSCGGCNGNTFSASHLQNTGSLNSTIRNSIATKCDELSQIGTLNAWALVAESGRTRSGAGTPECHEWLEHHQLGDMWR